MKKIFLFTVVVLMLSGCGIIDKSIRSDESIKEKTAFALGTTGPKIKITNKTADIASVRYNAIYNGKKYQCYYESLYGVMTSDVVCNTTSGGNIKKPFN